MDPVSLLVLVQLHVVPAERRDENHGRHVVKALNPLAPLRPLPANIKHAVGEVAVREFRLNDSRRAYTCAQHILV